MKYLLEIEKLKISSHDQLFVSDATFSVKKGTLTALIGESGSGKSLTARAIIDLLPQGFNVTSGSIKFAGENLSKVSTNRKYRGKNVGKASG